MYLDRNIFHFKSLPNDDAFLQYVADDHHDYGDMVCAPEPPKEQVQKASTPSYLACTGADVALSNLLSVSDILSPGEDVRVGTCRESATLLSVLQVLTGGGKLLAKIPVWHSEYTRLHDSTVVYGIICSQNFPITDCGKLMSSL